MVVCIMLLLLPTHRRSSSRRKPHPRELAGVTPPMHIWLILLFVTSPGLVTPLIRPGGDCTAAESATLVMPEAVVSQRL